MTTRQSNIETVAFRAMRTIRSEAEMNTEEVYQATAKRVRQAVEDIISTAPNPAWSERETQAAIRSIENRSDVRRGWWSGPNPWRHRGVQR
jgi:hypothetical protein